MAALALVASILGAVLPAAPQVEAFFAAQEQREIKAAFNREAALFADYRGRRDASAAAAAQAAQLAMIRLSQRMSGKAQALLPPLFSAKPGWQWDLSLALVNKELEQ
jgi:hypothetical protein